MRSDLAAWRIAQFMLERFGKRLQTGLGHVISRVAGWRRDALLRTGVNDEARAAACDHPGHEGLSATNDAPQIHVEHPFPVSGRPEHGATRLNPCVVHEDIRTAKAIPNRRLEAAQVLYAAHVRLDGHHIVSSSPRKAANLLHPTHEVVLT